MSRRKNRGRSKRVSPQLVSTPRSVSLSTVVVGLVAGAAGAALVYVLTPKNQYAVTVPTAIAPVVTSTPKHPKDVLMDRFNALSLEQQHSLVQRVFVDVELKSGMGAVYDSIVNSVGVEVLNEDSLRVLAQSDASARIAVSRLPTIAASRFGYNPELEKIIRRDVSSEVDLTILLKFGLTLKGQHAAMSLAHVFESNNPERGLRSWLRNNDLVNENGDVLYDRLTPDLCDYFARNFLLNSVASRRDVGSFLRDYQARAHDRRRIGKIALQILAPRMEADGGKVGYEVPQEALAEINGANPVLTVTPRYVSILRGYFAGSSTPDVSVMKALAEATGCDGQALRNIEFYVRGLGEVESLQRKGEFPLLQRADAVRGAIKSALERAFNQ